MSSSTPTWNLPSQGRTIARRGRIWLAYGLALLVPGAGHAYAGHWRRGLVWAGLCVVSLAFLSTGALLAERTAAEPLIITLLRLESGGFAAVAFPLAVLVLNVVDLYGRLLLEDASAHASFSS
ncbi:hypothetical protein GWG54_12170 [Natronococcus sp. JC468]|uniref:DUF6677 family protein n=1 Tax=Natronococcus sp. JC468 TaxID=1961921 RepID=UPI00143AD47B|nr:DUF6677 family protein [Natronococcus sp. JC468]NKE36561.1 hypothetical protein [Natronococcus sp. JC468]